MSEIWDIFGEDPNCDWAGPHHEPRLATVEGTYEEAVAYAQTLPGWKNWGQGGKVVAAKIIPITKLDSKNFYTIRIYKDVGVAAVDGAAACKHALLMCDLVNDGWKTEIVDRDKK